MEKLKLTIYDNGSQEYHNQDGELHNPVGPAYIESNGYKEYLLNGKLHNENGPARIFPDGYEEYWLNNKYLTKEEWEKQVKQVKQVKEVEKLSKKAVRKAVKQLVDCEFISPDENEDVFDLIYSEIIAIKIS